MTTDSEQEKIGGLRDGSKKLTDFLENKNLSFQQFKEKDTQIVLKNMKRCKLEL